MLYLYYHIYTLYFGRNVVIDFHCDQEIKESSVTINQLTGYDLSK